MQEVDAQDVRSAPRCFLEMNLVVELARCKEEIVEGDEASSKNGTPRCIYRDILMARVHTSLVEPLINQLNQLKRLSKTKIEKKMELD